MSFYFWLRSRYKNESNLFGKLAALMDGDENAPVTSRNKKIIRSYLISKKIYLKMMRAFNCSFRAYKKELKNR